MQFSAYEEKLINKLITDSMDEKEQTKLKFGFYIVADTFKKGLFVYILAAILGVFWEVLIVHFSFLFIRQVTYGWHSPTHKGCILGSIALFVLLPYTISLVNLPTSFIYNSGLILIISIYILGPIGTQVNPIYRKKKILLKYILLIRLCLILILMCFIPIGVFKYILIGLTIQFTTLLIQFFKNGRI
ncbi:accessory gene regulator B family protein [Lysinibacillus sp. RS5]|uniref:accessory gene regulator B family protein n=1 Tax=unclassified Lysinibacillus TaxID=2636778 RepID=UPI0035BE3671